MGARKILSLHSLKIELLVIVIETAAIAKDVIMKSYISKS